MSVEEPEKAQERYDRVVSSTLMGLGAFIGNPIHHWFTRFHRPCVIRIDDRRSDIRQH